MVRRSPSRLLAAALALGVLSPAAAARAQNGDATRVVFERTGYRLTALGARTTVNARVMASGRPVADAPITFRVADTAVAIVNSRGVVLSRRVGRTRLWAVSGTDSASALLIVDQWAARFSFTPEVVRLNAVGQRTTLQVQARDASGNPVAGLRGNCRVQNDAIAQLAGTLVVARGAGVTWVRCTDRGVSDSVRIEVRQRPQRIAIEDKTTIQQFAVGDNFQLRLRAYDSEGGEIRDPSPTWASLDPRSVNVDPLTGAGRAVAPSDVPVKVVAQLGDVTDTIAISVRPGAGLGLISAAGPSTEQTGTPTVSLEAPRPQAMLRLEVLSPTVGDTSLVTITARNAAGQTIEAGDVRLRSSDTSIVRYIGRQRIVARKEGSVWLIGTHDTLIDSLQVNVRALGSDAIASGAPSRPFVRPVYDLAAARRRDSIQLDTTRRAILSGSPIRSRLRQMVAFAATASQVHHAAQSVVLEERSGLLFGGSGAVMPFRMLTLTGDVHAGTLSPSGTTSEDMRVVEGEGGLNFAPFDWITVRSAYTMRTEITESATQQWKFASVSGLFRLRFVGGAMSTVFGATLLPYATYSGILDDAGDPARANPTSLGGQAGLELQTRWLNAGLTYHVERFTFPVTNGIERSDQVSALRLKVGVQFGR